MTNADTATALRIARRNLDRADSALSSALYRNEVRAIVPKVPRTCPVTGRLHTNEVDEWHAMTYGGSAKQITAFRRVVLPQIGGALLVSGIFAFITSFDEVETTIFIVRPAVNTLPVAMYHHLEQYQDPTLAALSTLLIVFTFVIVLIVPFAVRGNALLKMMGSGRH